MKPLSWCRCLGGSETIERWFPLLLLLGEGLVLWWQRFVDVVLFPSKAHFLAVNVEDFISWRLTIYSVKAQILKDFFPVFVNLTLLAWFSRLISLVIFFSFFLVLFCFLIMLILLRGALFIIIIISYYYYTSYSFSLDMSLWHLCILVTAYDLSMDVKGTVTISNSGHQRY